MSGDDKDLMSALPRPPRRSRVRTTNVWIVEWLPDGELQTGQMLHEWLEQRRSGWSGYIVCQSKTDVLRAIAEVTNESRRSGRRPVLHLEAHGGNRGLEGPDGRGGFDFLTWDELAGPLQSLNVATGCNLVVFVAACVGFAGIQALSCGPQAPAVALIGPDAEVTPRDLLAGMKECYRRWMDEEPALLDVVESASRELEGANFECELFVDIAYDATVKLLREYSKPEERRRRAGNLKARLINERGLSMRDADRRVAAMSSFPARDVLQCTWDELFMIDVHPENQERFGLDVGELMEQVADLRTRAACDAP